MKKLIFYVQPDTIRTNPITLKEAIFIDEEVDMRQAMFRANAKTFIRLLLEFLPYGTLGYLNEWGILAPDWGEKARKALNE